MVDLTIYIKKIGTRSNQVRSNFISPASSVLFLTLLCQNFQYFNRTDFTERKKKSYFWIYCHSNRTARSRNIGQNCSNKIPNTIKLWTYLRDWTQPNWSLNFNSIEHTGASFQKEKKYFDTFDRYMLKLLSRIKTSSIRQKFIL